MIKVGPDRVVKLNRATTLALFHRRRLQADPAFTGKEAAYQRYQAALAEYRSQLAEYNNHVEYERRTRVAYWQGLDGLSFERELAQVFTRHGYKATLTATTGDGGVDIILEKAGRKTFVQCKRYKSSVGVAAVRELYGVLLTADADDGILASVSGFTSGVHKFVVGGLQKPIRLLDVEEIVQMHQQCA